MILLPFPDMTNPHSLMILKPTLSILTLAGVSAFAQNATTAAAPAAPSPEPSVYDKIWGYTTLYKDKDNSFIQEFSITGRQQNDYYFVDATQGQNEDWVNRRTRLGAKAKLFQSFTAHVETDLNLEQPKPLYSRLTDAYVKWSPSKSLNVTVGKHGAKFTLDGSTSSTALITMDRSQIANNFWFPDEYIPGVSVNGEIENWLYSVSAFSSGSASNKEFGDFSAGYFGVASIGYNFAKALSVDKAIVKTELMLQEEARGTNFTRTNEMVGSLNFLFEDGPCGFGGDLVTSRGYGTQPDMYGVQLMPSYFFDEAKKLQGVFRYTFIQSDGKNGIRFARYENSIMGSKRGDEYQEFYAGFNYYLYGNKLKFQTGIQHSSMEDKPADGGRYDGWSLTTGIRISW